MTDAREKAVQRTGTGPSDMPAQNSPRGQLTQDVDAVEPSAQYLPTPQAQATGAAAAPVQ